MKTIIAEKSLRGTEKSPASIGGARNKEERRIFRGRGGYAVTWAYSDTSFILAQARRLTRAQDLVRDNLPIIPDDIHARPPQVSNVM